MVIGIQPTLQLKVAVANIGDPAFLAFVNLRIPETCNLVRVPQSCQLMIDERLMKCLLGNPLDNKLKVRYFEYPNSY